MKVYIAGAYCYRDVIADRVAPILNRLGHEVTSGWLNGERPITEGTIGASLDRSDQQVLQATEGDFADIERSDVVLLLTGHAMVRLLPKEDTGYDLPVRDTDYRLHTGGRHVESGFALSQGIPVVVAGPPENVFQRTQMVHFESLAQALDRINELDAEEQQHLAERDALLLQRDPAPSLNDMVQSAYDPRAVRFTG